METSSCISRSTKGNGCAINVGDSERTISAVAGGLALLYGLSKLSLPTVVASLAGGALLYRGLTGHCSLYQALEMSTAGDGDEKMRAGSRTDPRHKDTDASLAATGESPPISR